MTSFNRFLLKTSLILLVLFLLSTSVAVVYVILQPSVFDEMAVRNPDGSWNVALDGEKSSAYNTISLTSVYETEGLVPNIVIESGTDDIRFVEEDRDTIWVEYVAEQPDTDKYITDYSFTTVDNTLVINTDKQITNLILDEAYSRTLYIHVPVNYEFATYSLVSDSSLIDNRSIPASVASITINSDFSKVDIDTDHPLDLLVVKSNYGDIDITNSATINTLDLQADLGNITLDIKGAIGIMHIDSQGGNTSIDASQRIASGEINKDSGNVTIHTTNVIDQMTIVSPLGNMALSLPYTHKLYIEESDTLTKAIEDGFELVDDMELANIVIHSASGKLSVAGQ